MPGEGISRICGDCGLSGLRGSAAMSRVRRPRRSGTLFQMESAKLPGISTVLLRMGGILALTCANFKQNY
jgi:hypothetical protein